MEGDRGFRLFVCLFLLSFFFFLFMESDSLFE